MGVGGAQNRICRISARLETHHEEGEMDAMWVGFVVCLALAFMSWRGVRR